MSDRKFLLIIEPDSEVRQGLVSHLGEITNFVIIDASDGVMAFQKARNQKFDVILTEYDVPKLPGIQIIAAIRETDTNELSHLLFYTKNIEEAKIKTRGIKNIYFQEKPAEYQKIANKLIKLSNTDPQKKRFRLDVDFINPFIDSAMTTLDTLCKVPNIKPMKPYVLGDELLEIDISGTLAITSPYFRGSIAVSFDNDGYKKIVSNMIEENVNDIDIDNQDGAAEIINIIFGQTKVVLNQRGYSLERAIPSVMRGHQHKIYPNSKIPILLVPFRSDLGKFYIQICVRAI